MLITAIFMMIINNDIFFIVSCFTYKTLNNLKYCSKIAICQRKYNEFIANCIYLRELFPEAGAKPFFWSVSERRRA